MPAPFMSEAAKVREMPHVMRFINGNVLDYGCGGDKITPDAYGVDGRELSGVNMVIPDLENPNPQAVYKFTEEFDVVFSSHFLEHTMNPYGMVSTWYQFIKPGGYLVLYLPDGRHYKHADNFEHLWDINMDNFLFWFRRNFCGEGKNYRGQNLTQYFNLIDWNMDVGEDRYSFYIVAKAL